MSQEAPDLGLDRLPSSPRRNEGLFYLNTLITSIFFTVTGVACTVGVFFTCLVRELGGSEKAVSFIPVAWCLAALPSTVLGDLSERLHRNREVAIGALLCACALTGLNGLLLALMGPGHKILLPLTLCCLFLGHLISNLYLICYLAWMPDAVGQDRTGRAMSGRLLLWSVAQLISLPVCGWIFQRYPGVRTFGVVTMATSLLGMFGALPLATISPQGGSARPNRQGAFEVFSLLRDPPLRRMMGMVFLVNMSIFFVGAYGVVFVREFLEFPYKWVGIAYAIPSLLMMVSIMGWGRLADSAGAKGPCLIGVCGLTLSPLFFFLCAPGHTAMVWPGMIWSGAVCSAYSASWLPMVCTLSPAEKRASALGLIWLACSLAGLVTPLLGGMVVQAVGARSWVLGSWKFGGIHLLFLAQAFICVWAIPLCRSIRMEKSVPTRHLAEMFLRNPLRALWAGVGGGIIATAFRRSERGE